MFSIKLMEIINALSLGDPISCSRLTAKNRALLYILFF
jgi:hypothetical protein